MGWSGIGIQGVRALSISACSLYLLLFTFFCLCTFFPNLCLGHPDLLPEPEFNSNCDASNSNDADNSAANNRIMHLDHPYQTGGKGV